MASAGTSSHDPVKAVSPALPLPAKQSSRPNTTNQKSLDTSRKQSAASADSHTRKPATPPLKAWQGPNPITSRSSSNSALVNGTDKASASSSAAATSQPPPPLSQPSTISMASRATDKLAHDRLLFLLANMTGLDATVTLKDGEQFTGVLSGGSFDTSAKSTYTLKMVKRTQPPSNQQTNGSTNSADAYIGEGDDHTMSFDVQNTIDLRVDNVVTSTQPQQNGVTPTSSFRTDTEISSRTTDQPREKKLQRWAPDAADMSLEDMSIEDSGANGWDQFKANEQRYGVSSSYDEDIYTTSIDRSHPQYTRRLAEAERLAREIESSTSTNAHVAEERRQNIDRADEGDEEEKYSGVKREYSPLSKGASGSYVPPSRRPITSNPTVPGAPYDPAIISSQLARTKPAQTSSTPAATDDKSTTSANAALQPSKSTAQPDSSSSAATSIPAPKSSPNTTEDHVRDTADAFKQFANTEKLRFRQAQEQKRTNARIEKNVRINDLKKFAENFKLKSRVPEDLVPILAKDHDKQQEIKRKAEEAAQVEEQRSKDQPARSSPSAASSTTASSVAKPASAQQAARQKPVNRNHFVPQPLPGMSPRQAQFFKGAAARGVVPPQQLPASILVTTASTAPTDSAGPLSPSSTGKLNVNAKAFNFRPAASTFMPSGTSPSPARAASSRPTSTTPASFFDEKEKSNIGKGTDGSIDDDSDIVKWLQTGGVEGLTDEQKKSLASLGGVPQPYRTPPTWNVPPERINTLYEDAFGKSALHDQMQPMMHLAGPLPHAHQLPMHMQGNVAAQQARYFQQPGMPHPQQFDPRMQYPNGPASSVQSSPRFPNAQMTLGQMPQYMGMPQFAGQPMPYAGMSPNLAFRQPHMPGNANQQMMMVPGQSHGPMAPMRGYQQGQHFAPNMPQMSGHMMMQGGQPGPYGNGQVSQQPYSPLPHNAQPHLQHMGQHPGQPSFSASPRPGPHMMHHTGSHQGYQPHQMGMAYAQMPGQPSPYAMNQRQMSAGHFPQMTPRQQQAIPVAQAQPSPSPAAPPPNASKSDEGK